MGCEGFRWQVPLDTGIYIPFERGDYKIAIEMVVIMDHAGPTGLYHICVDPTPRDSILWLANDKALHSICSLVVDVENDLFQIEFGKLKFFDIDLSQTHIHFKLSLYNESGVGVKSKGYCILKLRPH